MCNSENYIINLLYMKNKEGRRVILLICFQLLDLGLACPCYRVQS